MEINPSPSGNPGKQSLRDRPTPPGNPNSKSVSSLVEAHKNRPILFILSIVLLVGLVVLALYLSFAKSAIRDQQKQLGDQIASLHSQIAGLKTQNLEGQQFAKDWLTQLEKTEIYWSKVIKTLQDLLPLDPLSQKPLVSFLSYSGSANGKLTLNAQTFAGSLNAFGDISNLLNVFNNSAFFKDAYVPSISHGLTTTGQDLLTFVFNVTYNEHIPDLQPGFKVAPQTPVSTQQVLTPVAPLSGVPALKVTRPNK